MAWVRAIAIVAVLMGGAQLGAAGEPAPPAPPSLASMLTVGARVSVLSTAAQREVSGVLVAVDDKVLALAPEGAVPLKVPVESILRVKVGAGKKRHWLRGLGIGVVAGLLSGLAFRVDPDDCGDRTTNFCSRGEAIAGGALGFGALGAGIGALVKTERWIPLTWGPNASTGGGPAGRGAGVRVTLRF